MAFRKRSNRRRTFKKRSGKSFLRKYARGGKRIKTYAVSRGGIRL